MSLQLRGEETSVLAGWGSVVLFKFDHTGNATGGRVAGYSSQSTVAGLESCSRYDVRQDRSFQEQGSFAQTCGQ